MGLSELDPEVLLRKIGASLEQSDIRTASTLIGRQALDESQLKRLQALAGMGDFRLHSVKPVMEIGELEANRRARGLSILKVPATIESTSTFSVEKLAPGVLIRSNSREMS